MASKKDQKKKNRQKKLGANGPGPNPFLQSGAELNSLDLLANVYDVPKAAEGREEVSSAQPDQAEAAVAEKAAEEEAHRKAEEEERKRKEAEAAEKARREAEEAERRRQEEEARRKAEEEERKRKEAEAAEKARREAEEAERRRQEEETRRKAEEEERKRKEAEAAEKARREAEEAERRRQEEVAAERARKIAEEAEKARREAERKRREAEEAERRRQAEEEEKRRAAEAAEKARREAEEADRQRREEESRRKAEEARRAAEEEDRRRREEEAAAAERARQLAAEEAKRREAEASLRERRQAEAKAADAGLPSAPPLEVDNPYWKKPPEIFDVLSGAPHGTPPPGTPSYIEAKDAGAMPVTMVETGRGGRDERSNHRLMPTGSHADGDHHDNEGGLYVPYDNQSLPPEKRLYIVMVTPEIAPCAKVGGLGDVILGLGRELIKRGHGVEVICPMYSCMRYEEIEDLHEEYSELWCPHYDEWRPEKVYQGRVGGELQVNFISGGTYTERPSIYGFDDDLERFTYFSRQALEFMYKTNRRPDIIHCHDWATGLVAPMLWDIYEPLGWNNSRLVYTIHNNECQGLSGFGDKLLSMVGMTAADYMRPDKMQDDTHKNCINMMKGGIVYSNFVTTVSPSYASELKTTDGGRGLQTTLAKNSAKVGGVLNGIDYTTWDPKTDDKLAARYSEGDDFPEKYKNKAALRDWLGLWDAWRPIISVVTRLTHQKGLDLIKHAIYASKKLQAQFVLLGSAPDPKVNDEFLRIQHEFKDDHDICLYIGYHEDLSHMIYAGSDMFLVPSLYEPCGLTQMISLRYGTVPIVRETGGLKDSVFDLDNSGRGLNDANGFTFRDANVTSLEYGLERAVRLWYDNPEAFNRLAKNGMRYDYSWKNPAQDYENIYNFIKA